MERTEIDAMRHIPLADFLARLGHEPVRRSGNELWYRAPYRNERTPSFRVNVAKQLWYDFGLGKGGDIFTLAGEFIGSNDFMEQVKFIAETANMPMPVSEMSKPTFLPKPSEPAFEGVEATPLFRSPLTDYLAERGIPYGIASRYCCRLNYAAFVASGISPSVFRMWRVAMKSAAASSKDVCLRRMCRWSRRKALRLTYVAYLKDSWTFFPLPRSDWKRATALY